MIRARVLAALALGACGVDLGASKPWEPIDQLGHLATALQPEVSPPGAFTSASAPVATDPVRVVTYNTEFGQDPEGLAAAILGDPELAKAGVFLIQEEERHPAEGASRAARLAQLLGVGYVYVPARFKQAATHGLALMSAFPIENVQKMDLPLASNGVPRIAVSADVRIGDRTLHVIDIHLETRLNARDRVAQLHPAVIDAAGDVLIAGDFNTNWITWAGKVPVLADVHDQAQILDSYMTSLGFDTPSARSGPTERRYGLEFRLDSIYTRGLEATPARVVRTGPSDHWPMYLDVRLSPATN